MLRSAFFFITVVIIAVFVGSCHLSNETTHDYRNVNLSVEERVEDLISRMTIEEKVYQMCALRLGEGDEIFKTSGDYSIDYIREQMSTHGVGHISCPTTDMNAERSAQVANEIQRVAIEETRLGIPTIINDEALHGCKAKGATCYPQSIALSCTWDLELMSRIGDAIGKETKSRGIRQVLSPNLDLARDPRHGRMEETYGEDPYLAGLFGVEYIKGVQGNGVICSPKHFVANFVAEGGRDAGNINFSERHLREIHLLPFEMVVKQAGVNSLMAAYNALDGIPCHANKWLLTDVLRTQWGFKGYVVSDWSGVNHLQLSHKVAESYEEAAIIASMAGLDVDLPRLKSYTQLIEMIKAGKVDEKSIDVNVRRILAVKFRLGLFENPYIEVANAIKLENPDEYRALALEAAQKSIVLLKNENHVLPINPSSVKKVAVLGPNATELHLGGYSANGVTGPTPLEGIKAAFGDKVEILYEKGCDITSIDTNGFSKALKVAKEADVCILIMGGQWHLTGGETNDRLDIGLLGVQERFIKAISAVGKPTVVVINDGRPTIVKNWINDVDGLIMAFFAGEEGGNALGQILTGAVNPSGKLSITFPRDNGQIPMNLRHKPYGREGRILGYEEMSLDYRYYPYYPFGFGLSYSTFKYGELSLATNSINKGESLMLKIDISNTSEIAGEEVIQFYLTDLYSSISRSKKELIGFERIALKPGETKCIEFIITPEMMEFYDVNMKKTIEAGEFEIFAGANCLEGEGKVFEVI